MPSPKRVRSLAATLLAALVLSACGSSDEEPSAAAPAAPPAEEASSQVTEARTVDHAMGATEVPGEPARVVVLDTPHLDAALSLDVTPVGASQSSVAEGLPGYLGERSEGIEVVGTIEEPDLEAVAALDPDLILSASVRHEQIYDQLSEIAPTVFTDYEDGWRHNFTLIADALGRADQGEQALADYRERAEEIGEEVAAADTSAAIVRFLPDETRIYGPDTFSGDVLTDIGFPLPTLEYDEYSMAYISPEQIGMLDEADVIFSTAYGDPAATTRDAVTALWGTLPAVQEGCQLAVEDDEWMLGIGLIGADIILDDVEAFLADGTCG